MNQSSFPWRRAMALGFGVLRLSSRDFWALTPRELAAAIDGVLGCFSEPLGRAAFDKLAARYPDRT
ncbi:MAG TPA: rcc01693 family protein [Bauldia sp.]|nr:rcc01693 family protein [Bauldia sp.]